MAEQQKLVALNESRSPLVRARTRSPAGRPEAIGRPAGRFCQQANLYGLSVWSRREMYSEASALIASAAADVENAIVTTVSAMTQFMLAAPRSWLAD